MIKWIIRCVFLTQKGGISSCNGIRSDNPLKRSIFVIDEGVARPPLPSPRIIPWIHNLDANSRHAWPVLERPWYFTDYEYLRFVSRYLDLSIQKSLSFPFLFSSSRVSFAVWRKKKKKEKLMDEFDRVDGDFFFFWFRKLIKKDGWFLRSGMRRDKGKFRKFCFVNFP